MTAVVPPRFLFRWSFPVRYFDGEPLADLPDAHALPSLSEMDGQADFATWRLGWNERGLALAVTVSGKRESLRCDPLSPAASSGVHVWIDTRATQNVHRATRFCHRFSLLPVGQGKQKQQPVALQLPLGAAREENSPARSGAVSIASKLCDDGYLLKAWFPTECLIGYDPESHSRLGFYGVVLDTELGTQPLTVGSEFPYESDPSLWQTLELVRG